MKKRITSVFSLGTILLISGGGSQKQKEKSQGIAQAYAEKEPNVIFYLSDDQ